MIKCKSTNMQIHDFCIQPDLTAPFWIPQRQQENPFPYAVQELG